MTPERHEEDAAPSAPGREADLPVEETTTASARRRVPAVVGEFRIVRELGEGGMGLVYEAEQQHPKRAVALKVIRGGAYVDETQVRMFRREVQTLARLKHPGIAAIYESGRTEDGQHYFAMELVRGETLSEHLKRRGGTGMLSPPTVKERLLLFRKICDAISYAHQRGVVHRDLKPSNILVLRDSPGTEPGSQAHDIPDIKILDFGLARITDSDVVMSTVLTDLGSVQGTLPYMSPEQVRGHSDEIDLRTDVYSLGVILYEMLAGQLPVDVRRAQLPVALRLICEESPQPLSRVWKGTRRPDADLVTIVHKALEKEPSRRYRSAAALSEEIQRYLADQPILAHPPSTAYQVRKLVARHKGPFAFVAALMVLLAGFAVTMTVQAGRIARERDRANVEAKTAQTVSEFLVGLFEVSDPFEARGNTVTARELLDKGAGRIARELSGEPLTQARLMATMGNAYVSLALYEPAQPLLEQALALRERELGGDHPDVAHALEALGEVHVRQRKFVEAQALFERALKILESSRGLEHPEVGWGLYNLQKAYWFREDYAGAAPLLERALKIFEKDPTANARGMSWCLNNLAYVELYWRRNPDRALANCQRALEIKRTTLTEGHPDVAIGLNNVGDILMNMGDYGAARPILERALAEYERCFGAQHPRTAANPLRGLGELWWRLGEPAKAKPLLERAIAVQEPLGYYKLPEATHTLAAVLCDLGEYQESEKLFLRTLKLREGAVGVQNPRVAQTLQEYARLLRRTKRDDEAQTMEARAQAILEQQAETGRKPPSPPK